MDDALLLWQWRNDPAVRARSFDSREIAWDTHRDWLARRLASSDCRIWIFESGSESLGQVRYERSGVTADISFSIAERFQRQGLGSRMLSESSSQACRALALQTVIALVKDDNLASQHVLERAGFIRRERACRNDMDCWRFERHCEPRESR